MKREYVRGSKEHWKEVQKFVYGLESETNSEPSICGNDKAIFVRNKVGGLTLYTDEIVYDAITTKDHIYWHGNITHNLGTIAEHCYCQCPDETSLYSILWRPEETTLLTVTGRLTSSYIKALSICLGELKEYRNYYEKFNPENGWGNYDALVNFVESLLVALNKIPKEEYNNYTVEASR